MKPSNHRITREEMGICAELPGLQCAIDVLLDRQQDLHAKLAELRNGGIPTKQGWSDDPAERKREMKRRIAVRAKKKKQAINGQAPDGAPEKEAFRAHMRKVGLKTWNSMSKAAQKRRIANLAAGRAAKRKLTAKLEAAS